MSECPGDHLDSKVLKDFVEKDAFFRKAVIGSMWEVARNSREIREFLHRRKLEGVYLKNVEATVLLLYFVEGGHTLDEIGKRLGLSGQRVRQHKESAVRKLWWAANVDREELLKAKEALP